MEASENTQHLEESESSGGGGEWRVGGVVWRGGWGWSCVGEEIRVVGRPRLAPTCGEVCEAIYRTNEGTIACHISLFFHSK